MARKIKKAKKNTRADQPMTKSQQMKLIGGVAAAVIILSVVLGIIFTADYRKETGNGSRDDTGENSGGNTGDDTGSNAGEESVSIDTSKTYYADIEIQDYGTVTFKFEPESAPVSTENFINLAESGFYDGLTFHRIIEGFMMQGGDPNGNGTGGSDETIVGEFSANGHENNLSHTRGAVSMARSSDYDSASSQFFIVHEDSTFLDGEYAVFGYVTEGMDVVDAVCEAAEPIDSDGLVAADAQPVIAGIVIRTE